MKFNDSKTKFGYLGNDRKIKVEDILEEIHSNAIDDQISLIQDFIDDYRDEIESLEHENERLQNILDDNDIEY